MNPILMAGTGVVTLALLAYSVSFVFQSRRRLISRQILFWQTTGVVLDIAATALMIAGSRNIALTFHGILGYSALLLQMTDTGKLWRARSHSGLPATISRAVYGFSKLSYGWWVFTYFAGAFIAMRLAH